ncbi:uncharacterized protein N0V89_000556 [Didymosphaeria variabile]|uniref:Uncharacterized protein n=1 Tax=Didymosphaeria variabile TaxID=1932322 RepID=A0A9W8XX05_9PLEO|nr:uncharacterized protein N0V89_000556 [Didymosphaeria variabile]KAJ4359997.1 hypothetical protein N0V89_000556 [Didymosphaeria variabile]
MEARHCHQRGEKGDVYPEHDEDHAGTRQTHEESSKDDVRNNGQKTELHANRNNNATTPSDTNIQKDITNKSISLEDFTAALVPYKSVIDISGVPFILEPFRCTLCHQPTSLAPTTKFSQRICDICRIALDADAPLRFLHDIVGKVYAFWLTLRREELCDRIERIDLPGMRTYFGIIEGIPGNKTTLPAITNVRVYDEAGMSLASHALSTEQRGLLEEVLLTVNQCHISLLVLAPLLEKLMYADVDSPVLQVGEYRYQPKHESCYSHCIHIFTLKDGRHFVVSFTDRQLGWYPLIVPYAEYLNLRVKIESVPSMYGLGYVHTETAAALGEPDLISEDERGSSGILQRERWLKVADEVVRRWEEWAKKEE